MSKLKNQGYEALNDEYEGFGEEDLGIEGDDNLDPLLAALPKISYIDDPYEDNSVNPLFANPVKFQFAMYILTMLNLRLSAFRSQVDSIFAAEDVLSEKELLSTAYSLAKANQLREEMLAMSDDPEQIGILQVKQVVLDNMSPIVTEEMKKHVKDLIKGRIRGASYDDLHQAMGFDRLLAQDGSSIERDPFKDHFELDVLSGKKALVLLYPKLGTEPVKYLLNKSEAQDFIAKNKSEYSLIKVFNKKSVRTEFIPSKTEMASVIEKAIQGHDVDFLKLCATSNKLSAGLLSEKKELLFELYKAGRLDIIDFCLENQLFGGDQKSIVDTKSDLLGTLLFDAFEKGDVKEFGRLLALGANPNVKNESGEYIIHRLVRYNKEELVELNKPAADRSEEFNQQLQLRDEMFSMLLSNSDVDINARDKSGYTSLRILVNSGLVKGDRDLLELRGDHKMMEKLLERGADPFFGQTELSFKTKTAITIALSIGLSFLKNRLFDPLGPIGRFALYPAVRGVEYLLDAVIFYKAYLDVKDPLYRYFRTALDSEYANDTLINLDKKCLIGSYHINWYGGVVHGERLKNKLSTHIGYNNYGKAYYLLKDIPVDEHGNLKLKLSERLEIQHQLFMRYYQIDKQLTSSWFMLFWKRDGLLEVQRSIEDAYYKIGGGFINDEKLNQLIAETFTYSNKRHLISELARSPDKRDQFFKLHAAVKQDLISADIEIRCVMQSIESTLLNNLAKFKPSKGTSKFSDLNDYLLSFNLDGKSLDEILEMSNTIKKAAFLMEANQDQSWGEFFLSIPRKVLNKSVQATAKLFGVEEARVYHYMAEGASSVGASANGALHIGLRELYDSFYFYPAFAVACTAYALYQWPKQTISFLAKTLEIVIGVFSLVGESVGKTAEFVSDLFKSPNRFAESINGDYVKHEANTALSRENIVVPVPEAVIRKTNLDLTSIIRAHAIKEDGVANDNNPVVSSAGAA